MESMPHWFKAVRSSVAQICRPQRHSKIILGSVEVTPLEKPAPAFAARVEYSGSVGVPRVMAPEPE